MSLSFDEIKKQVTGRWRIRKYYDKGYVVDHKGWIFWSVRHTIDGKIRCFKTIDDAKAYIDKMIQDDFVRHTKRGESEFTIYYP